MDDYIQDGWRFFDLKPFEVLALTHREFTLMSKANIEKMHDKHEQEALYAIFNAAANRGKGKKGKIPKVSDLYDRNKAAEVSDGESGESSDDKSVDKFENILERQRRMEDWLSRFEIKPSEEDGE